MSSDEGAGLGKPEIEVPKVFFKNTILQCLLSYGGKWCLLFACVFGMGCQRSSLEESKGALASSEWAENLTSLNGAGSDKPRFSEGSYLNTQVPVYTFKENSPHWCTGIIVSKNSLVLPAHCIFRKEDGLFAIFSKSPQQVANDLSSRKNALLRRAVRVEMPEEHKWIRRLKEESSEYKMLADRYLSEIRKTEHLESRDALYEAFVRDSTLHFRKAVLAISNSMTRDSVLKALIANGSQFDFAWVQLDGDIPVNYQVLTERLKSPHLDGLQGSNVGLIKSGYGQGEMAVDSEEPVTGEYSELSESGKVHKLNSMEYTYQETVNGEKKFPEARWGVLWSIQKQSQFVGIYSRTDELSEPNIHIYTSLSSIRPWLKILIN